MTRGYPHRADRSRGRMLLWVWAVVALVVLLFVWQRASVDRLAMQLERERGAHEKLAHEVNALLLEADRLSNLDQIQRRAQAELGLRPPATADIVDLRFSGEPHGHPGFVGDALAAPPEAPR